MKVPFLMVDAFVTDEKFSGNPAGVCLLETPLPDSLMQKIAMEVNQAETAFVIRQGNDLQIRWMTPTVEVDLCGHATLASSIAIWEKFPELRGTELILQSKSGELRVSPNGKQAVLEFPAHQIDEKPLPHGAGSRFENALWQGVGGHDWMVVLPTESDVINFKRDDAFVESLGLRGLIITASSEEDGVDIASRFFAPQSGVPEDHVTGSAHCALTPYWAHVLGKNRLKAKQLSPRGGVLDLTLEGDRVKLGGQARIMIRGELDLS